MVYIRAMKLEDWETVKEIYHAGLKTRNATFETEVPAWEKWNKSHLKMGRFVACINDTVRGWAALTPYSSRPVYRGVAEVSVYVLPEYQGLRIGTLLMKEILTFCKANEFWTLQSSIFPENKESLALHKKNGFRVVGVQKNIAQLDGEWRDVLLLEKKI